MRTIQKIISAGFASCALVSASVPALAWTVWPDVDFQWYADVGKPLTEPVVEVFPAPRPGWIWSPGHYERRGAREAWVAGHWIPDDYQQQLALYGNRATYVGNGVVLHEGETAYVTPNAAPTTAMPVLRDSAGNPIPTNPSAYPIDNDILDSSRR
jgi:hypothetical protein